MIDLDDINNKIKKGNDIENVLIDIDWKEFENLISEILKQHDFDIFPNFRFSTKNRYEIDLLAIKNSKIFAIDCKQWRRGRYKISGLKLAIRKQLERCNELRKVLVGKYEKIIPLVVTFFEENIIEYEDVFVVPLWKFNEFLLDHVETY